MNRLKDENDERPPMTGGDYFVVYARDGVSYVSAVMAAHIERTLDAAPVPAWVTFVDLAGARVRLRTGDIWQLMQCTAEQRAAERAHGRLLRQECRAERSWGEDA